MWLISLVGTHVFHDQVNVCVTSDLKNQSKIRDFIKQEYGIKFSTDIKSSRDCFSFIGVIVILQMIEIFLLL